MDELTNVVEEVVTETVEESVRTISPGTIVTGGFALLGVGAAIYGAVKAGKWVYSKVKEAKEIRDTVIEESEAANEDEE